MRPRKNWPRAWIVCNLQTGLRFGGFGRERVVAKLQTRDKAEIAFRHRIKLEWLRNLFAIECQLRQGCGRFDFDQDIATADQVRARGERFDFELRGGLRKRYLMAESGKKANQGQSSEGAPTNCQK